MIDKPAPARRRLLRQVAYLAAASASPMVCMPARASAAQPRALALVHTHTPERIDVV
jgi:hypothetical protein